MKSQILASLCIAFLSAAAGAGVIPSDDNSPVAITLQRQAAAAGSYPGSVDAADRAFIGNDYQSAITLYETAIGESGTKKEALLPRYRVPFIYDTRMHDCRIAAALYGQFVKDYPDNPLSALARQRISEINRLEERNELDAYEAFMKLKSEFLGLPVRGRGETSSKKQEAAARGLIRMAEDSAGLSFRDEMLQSILTAMVNAREYLFAAEIARVIKSSPETAMLIAPEQDTRIFNHVKRFHIYRLSLAVLAGFAVFIVAGRGWRGLGPKKLAAALPYAVPALAVLSAWWFFSCRKDTDAHFHLDVFAYLLLAHAATVAASLMLGEAFAARAPRLAYPAKLALGAVMGAAVWMVFSYRVEYMFILRI